MVKFPCVSGTEWVAKCEMTILTKQDIQKMEESYYWNRYENWRPFSKELKKKILVVYGKEPLPHVWTEQDIYEGSRKMILEYFQSHSE